MNDNASSDGSAFSSEKTLERLAGARGVASKEANRLFLTSIVLAGLYLIKASGLRVDLTLFDTDIGKVPHGLFFFLVASQISIILCYMRTADAVALDSRLRSSIQRFSPVDEEMANNSFPNDFEWFGATENEFSAKPSNWIAKLIYEVTSVLTAPTTILLYLLPSICGVFSLLNWDRQITTGDINLQYWCLFGTTSLSILWFMNFIVVHFSLRKM